MQVLHSMFSHFVTLCFTTDISDSVTNPSAPQTLLLDVVYLTESTIPARLFKYQSAKLLVADLFTCNFLRLCLKCYCTLSIRFLKNFKTWLNSEVFTTSLSAMCTDCQVSSLFGCIVLTGNAPDFYG